MASTGVSRSTVNLAANALYEAGFLGRERRGRMNFYTANDRHPFVRQFKILDTIALLGPLLMQLQPLSRRIVLFGSCAQGTDAADSDVDLFILTSDRSQVMALISHNRLERPVQLGIDRLKRPVWASSSATTGLSDQCNR